MTCEECPTCNQTINVLEPGEYFLLSEAEQAAHDQDEAEHREIHPVVVAAFKELGYWPRGMRQRRELDEQGSLELASGSEQDRFCGAYKCIESLFDRSLNKAVELGYWREHPKHWTEFAKLLDLPKLFPAEIAEYMRAEMGPALGPLIGSDMYWEPVGWREAP